MEKNIDDFFAEKGGFIEEEVLEPETETADVQEEEDTFETILVCEECNNQWEDLVSDSEKNSLFCPMCGSSRIVMI